MSKPAPRWLWFALALVIVLIAVDRGTPAQAQPSQCDEARALQEIAVQMRRQTAALERIAERLK